MVQRQSQEVSFGEHQERRVSQAAAGFKAPDFNRAGSERIQVDTGRSQVLQGLLGAAKQLAEKRIDRDLEEQYLRGAALASQGFAEAEIEANPLTRQWAVAGYRDTVGRLKIAESEATLAQDMQRLREHTPEKFQEYLAERRGDLLNATTGMSAEQRKASLGKLIMNDVAATQQHKTEHVKFIIDTQRQSISTSVGLVMQQLTDATKAGDVTSAEAARDRAIGVLEVDILANPRLPDSVKQEMVLEVMQHALATDNVMLYQYLKQNPIVTPEGDRSVLEYLPLAEQTKLAAQGREAEQRVNLRANTQYLEMKAGIEAGIAAGTLEMSYSEVKAFADEGVLRGAITASGYEGMLQSFLGMSNKVHNGNAATAAVMAGDTLTLGRLGKSEQEAVQGLVDLGYKAGKETPEIIGDLLTAASNGVQVAATKAGELLSPAFRQLDRPDGTVDAQHAETITMVNEVLRVSREQGLSVGTRLLEGMPEDVRGRASSMFAFMRRGYTTEGALTATLNNERLDAGMSPAQKAARGSTQAKEHAAFVQGLGPRGLFETMGLGLKSIFSADAGNTRTITQRAKWFENEAVALEAAAQIKGEVSRELRDISASQPHLSVEAQQSMALANVAARTLDTDFGPVVLPKDLNLAQFFGAKPQDSKELMGQALNHVMGDLTKEHRGADNYVFHFAQGKLQYASFKDGLVLQNVTLDPKAVGTRLTEMKQSRVREQDRLIGKGVTVRKEGINVTFNGENSAGVEPSWMLKFRTALVKNESVRDRPYRDGQNKDGSPRYSIGVGVNSSNPEFYPKAGPDGTISMEQIHESFLGASDHAAKRGWDIAQTAGIGTEQGFLLASELVYQAGAGHINAPGYPEMYGAIRNKDADAAVKAFRKTTVYRVSGARRKAHYEEMIKQAAR